MKVQTKLISLFLLLCVIFGAARYLYQISENKKYIPFLKMTVKKRTLILISF
ncbi:MAG: hypothetical protein M0R66_01015 [Candidatus Omnitrophica bacterium]|nr:hypothetical protein [Candidatus Omnitrophota bacterium]